MSFSSTPAKDKEPSSRATETLSYRLNLESRIVQLEKHLQTIQHQRDARIISPARVRKNRIRKSVGHLPSGLALSMAADRSNSTSSSLRDLPGPATFGSQQKEKLGVGTQAAFSGMVGRPNGDMAVGMARLGMAAGTIRLPGDDQWSRGERSDGIPSEPRAACPVVAAAGVLGAEFGVVRLSSTGADDVDVNASRDTHQDQIPRERRGTI